MPSPPRQRPLLEDIERRILYSADTPAGALAAALPHAEPRAEQAEAHPTAPAQPAVELVVLDERVPDADALLQGLATQAAEGRHLAVVRVGAEEDGVAAIAAALAGRSDVAALHIVSHGGAGEVQLGRGALDNEALLARAPDIAGWGSHLARGADILLYGCDVASDANGRALVQGLAALTGADVAASTDATGAATLGGNWQLEMQTGHIEAQLAFGLQAQARWQGLLATYTVTSTADSGAGSLRQAILDANNTPGADTIGFAIAGTGVHTIALASALPAITRPVVIDGTTDTASFAANGGRPAIVLDGGDGNYTGLVLAAGSGGSTIRGLVITNFQQGGIGIATGSDGNTIAGNYIGALDASGTEAATTVGSNSASAVEVGSAGNTIGGLTAADRNVIAGARSRAIRIGGAVAVGNTVIGNYIGTDASGTTALGNGFWGVDINVSASGTTVGGTSAAQRNVIADNGDGVAINDATGTTVQGNYIGVGADGTTALGNGSGIQVFGTTAGTLIGGTAAGAGNVVAHNGDAGIVLADADSLATVLGNRVFANAGLGIDLAWDGVTANDTGDADSGPNQLQNFPVLASASLAGDQFTVAGSLDSEAGKTYRIEFFGIPYGSADGSGHGGGNVFLGFVDVTTDGSGHAGIQATLAASGLAGGAYVTATATEQTGAGIYGATSEFSANVQANTAPVLTVAANAAYTEKGTAVALAPAATVVDTELAAAGNYAGATLTLARSGGANAEDTFAATGGTLAALAQGASLVYGGTTVGTVAINSGGTLVLDFNGNATQALVDDVLRAIGYANSSAAPPASVQLAWSFSDGNTGAQGAGGALAGSGSTTVGITAVNDAPAGADARVATPQDTAYTFTAADFGFSDVDGNALQAVRIATVPGAGSLTLGGVAVAAGQAIGVADIDAGNLRFTPAARASGAGYASFTFQVQDDGGTALGGVDTDPVPRTLAIDVTRVNAPPVITSNGGGASAAIAVAENTTAVTTVTATDVDGPGLGYTISGGADAALFTIDAGTGVLRFLAPPDHERPADAGGGNVYHVVVRASDGSAFATQAIAVTVTDVDEAPVGAVVDADPAANQVAGHAAHGTPVGITAHAVDPDGTATVGYSLADDAGGRFAIDAVTGVVTVADGTLLQGADGFTIQVLATSTDGSTSTVAFDVAVVSTDTQAPVITSPASVAVPENTASVLQVTARDADSPAGALVFSIAGGADAARFAIDARTGALRFIAAPDFEMPADADGDNLYVLRVRVSDGRQSSEQALAVQVTPVNDNVPRFTTPGGVVEVLPGHVEVIRVQATDDDLPAQALRYAIVGGADAARFAVDAQTGALRWAAAPDGEAPGGAAGPRDYAVVVGVSDGLYGAQLALTVHVRDVAGTALPGGTVQVSVPEQQTAVTTVTATGTDGQPLQYALAGGADAALFDIDAATGRLWFREPPWFTLPRDADRDNLYEVLVRVSDGDRTGDYRILVTVTGHPVEPQAPLPAAPVAGTTPPAVLQVLPALPAAGTGQGVGSASTPAGRTGQGGLALAGGPAAVEANQVPGTRPAPGVLLAPATQQPLPADLLPRVPWRQFTFHATWAEAGTADLLLPALLGSQPATGAALAGRGAPPGGVPVVAGAAEDTRGSALQASAVLDQALAGGIAIGLGAAFWASRGSALLASLLAMSPAWAGMDPLPVLDRRQRGARDPRAQPPLAGDAQDDQARSAAPEAARSKDGAAVPEDGT
ncbi:DUF4347 domain-containing protein [Pseudorhodoferax sp. Leaf274]|uniref:DUF4347 domain-containing protein n=1 Tax=Pseudorhodoferax sp. Leaf274 TaxID=1736318 RepID=UPI00070303CB|nr:DUF4347 domain-containing protein [Pseudorhodoferax sp. Leaf274]KQP44266.1 hypothetical protein ASF44_28555 [Pseudorhodoferax sp. Leaf274]